jgi:hypothetical protein
MLKSKCCNADSNILFGKYRCSECYALEPTTKDGKQLDLFEGEHGLSVSLSEDKERMFNHYGCVLQYTLPV